MKAILAIIMAAIGLYIGINLLPGLNTTVATITTPTYSSGVTGMVGVVLIVFAAMLVSKNAYPTGNSSDKSALTLVKPKLSNEYGNAELSRMGLSYLGMRREHIGGNLVMRLKTCSDTP